MHKNNGGVIMIEKNLDNDILIYKAVSSNSWFNDDYDDIDFQEEMKKVGNPDTMQVGKENIPR